MKHLKKVLPVILAIALIVSLFAACGTSQQEAGKSAASTQADVKKDDSTAAKPAEKKTLVFFEEDDFIKDSFKDFYKEFEDQNNVSVKPILVPKDKYVQTLMVTINGGQPLDVLFVNGQDVRALAKKGILADLSNDIKFWDRFYDNAVEQYTFGGKKYGVPGQSGATSGVYYNKEVLDKNGLQPPKTFADLVAMNKVLNKNGISTFGFGGATKYMWPMWYFDTFAQTSGGKSIERTIEALQGKAKFTDPDFVEAMKVLENFGKENLFQKGFNGADSAAGNAVFVSGKAALFFGGTWEIDGFRKAGLAGNKLGMVAFPIVKEGAVSQQTGTSSGSSLSIYSKIVPENKDLALKLVDYLSSDKKSAELIKLLSGAMSPNKAVKLEGVDPLYDSSVNKDLLPNTVTFLDWIWAPEITKEFQDGIQAVVGGKIKAEDEMARIQKVFDDIKAKGYDFDTTK